MRTFIQPIKKLHQSSGFPKSDNHTEFAKPFFSPSIKQQTHQSQLIVQLKPNYLKSVNFLGLPAEVNPVMEKRLKNVAQELDKQYNALPANAKPATLANYAGLQSIRGWRAGGTSKHASGSAVDVNYDNQPYIATRSQEGKNTVYGGEEGKATDATRALRIPAVEAYDRAVQFVSNSRISADVNRRRSGESTEDVYRRFKATSDNLATYLSLVFKTDYNKVSRVPVQHVEVASEDELSKKITLSERKDEGTAIQDITAFVNDPAWQASHPGFSRNSREMYFRILRDYEHVRTPMLRGNPTATPNDTRNPALGFLHMPEHFVVAMTRAGNLRWGAADLGPKASGDVHHFDLGDHGGYEPDGAA